MSDETNSRTAKLPPPPPNGGPPSQPVTAPAASASSVPREPATAGFAAPSTPAGSPPEPPRVMSNPPTTPVPRPTEAPPVGPPRFPLPGRRRAEAKKAKGASAKGAPTTPEDKARAAEQREEDSAELIGQRDRLLEKFTVMQSDLGGAFYEMAIRDHVRLDVLTRKAAELQRVDAELLAVERVLELERADAAGLCPGCGAPYGHAVRFCAQCGTPLVPTEAGA